MPSIVLQALLGDEELEMINIYVRRIEKDITELYTRFSPIDTLEMHRATKGKREQMRKWCNARKEIAVKFEFL